MNIVIYGAQSIALGAYNAIRSLHPEMHIECFLVTELANNAMTLGGIHVRELAEFAAEKTDDEKNNIEVLIGTPENVMGAIEKSLEEAGIHHHVRLDSMKWAEMQKKAFIKAGRFTPLSTYPTGIRKPDIEIYQMVHHKDKLLETDYKFPDYFIPVQAGAATTDRVIAQFSDSTGYNISAKNGDYSELTGLYWIWKNRVSQSDGKYYGLAHYRRFLELSETDHSRLATNDIDVVLPYPMPYEPDIEAHHLRYLTKQEWSGVIQALKEIEPEYAEEFNLILKQEYLYNYNIVLAKSEVLDKYCNWLFPLLFRIEEINNPNGNKEPNRYIGYVGETLETLYFMHNKDKLKIAHTGCRFLV